MGGERVINPPLRQAFWLAQDGADALDAVRPGEEVDVDAADPVGQQAGRDHRGAIGVRDVQELAGDGLGVRPAPGDGRGWS